GLYLNPPSSGGLWDGVITMPSARPSRPGSPRRPALWLTTACETTGVGTGSSAGSAPGRGGRQARAPSGAAAALETTTRTPFAASTSTAVRSAGSESAWVSAPRNRGPVTPRDALWSATAWHIAAMWSSLNDLFTEV